MKFKSHLVIFLSAGFVLTVACVASAQRDLASYCSEVYLNDGECPSDVCTMGCYGDVEFFGCKGECQPKDCLDITPGKCPAGECRLLEGCGGKKVCFPQATYEPEKCGALAYAGEMPCCEGLVKRCGIDFFDGSCDMLGEQSMYGVPICIPCGDGKCTQFENNCNCPEDCGS